MASKCFVPDLGCDGEECSEVWLHTRPEMCGAMISLRSLGQESYSLMRNKRCQLQETRVVRNLN